MNILIIEDNESDVLILKKHIEAAGHNHKTDIVDNIEDAKNYIAQESYNLIFLDLFLTDSEGFDTIEKIHNAIKTTNNKETPIIILTGLADYNLGEKALKLGIKDFIIKDAINTKKVQRSLNMYNYKDYLPKKSKNIFNIFGRDKC